MNFDLSAAMGTVGVAMLLVAFFMNLLGRMSANSATYLALNSVGAGLAALYALVLWAPPLIVLEGAWAIAAAYKLIKLLLAGPPARPQGRKFKL